MAGAGSCQLPPPGASALLLASPVLPGGLSSPRGRVSPSWRRAWEEALLILSPCIQEAEQSFIAELAALARVPLAESKPSSSKRGLPGEEWARLGRGVQSHVSHTWPWEPYVPSLGLCVISVHEQPP